MSNLIVKRLVESINSQDLDALVNLFAEDLVSEWPAHPSRSFEGRDNVRRNWEMIFRHFPELQIEVVDSIEVDNVFWGDFHYVRQNAPDLRGVIIITVEDDLIARSRFFMEEIDEAPPGTHPMPGVEQVDAGGPAGD